MSEKMQQAIARMKQLAEVSKDDAEAAHSEADELVIEMMRRDPEYYEFANAFAAVGKWYS